MAEDANMMLQELLSFKSIYTFLVRIEQWHLDNQAAMEKLQEEIKTIDQSNAQSFGFIRKTSKVEKIAALRAQQAELEGTIRTGDELLKIAYDVITGTEMVIIREKKQERHTQLLQDFAKAKMRSLETELRLWTTIQAATKKTA